MRRTYGLSLFIAYVIVGALTACTDGPRSPGAGGLGAYDAAGPATLGDGGSGPAALVYAHSDITLYTIDPDSLAVAKVGDFGWPVGTDAMTDIALDKAGHMVGITASAIYAVEPTTAKCTLLSTFEGYGFNGLSFIASASSAEILVAASAADGQVFQIDRTTGTQTSIGSYGHGYGSSGDLVSVAGATYATVSGAFDTTDGLVQINPSTGNATLIGNTGVPNIWGLGYWKQKVFGFSESNGIVIIDVGTGHSTPVSGSSGISWYGAGVTTAAPTSVN